MTQRWIRTVEEFTRVANWQKPDWIQYEDESLNVGRWRNESGQPAVIELESETIVHDWIYSWGIFVVSERLRRLIEQFDVNAEFLPVRIVQDGIDVQQSPFYCCNLLDAIDCFDFKKGECTIWPSGNIRGIKVLSIDESKADSFHLFRLGHGYDSIVLVSDKLADAIKKNGLTGMGFMTIESWPEMA